MDPMWILHVVAGGVPTTKPDKVPTKKGRQGCQTVDKPHVPESGWSPLKRVAFSDAPVKDKLVNDGWSAPIVVSISDLNISEFNNDKIKFELLKNKL